MIVSRIRSSGKELILACDGKCEKAWGINQRPKVAFDGNDEDDFAYLADDELGLAPADPETYEGGEPKPQHPVHNKWCYRECERSHSSDCSNLPVLPDFSQRLYNQPWKHLA